MPPSNSSAQRNTSRKKKSSGLSLFVFALIVIFVFFCGLYVGSSFVHNSDVEGIEDIENKFFLPYLRRGSPVISPQNEFGAVSPEIQNFQPMKTGSYIGDKTKEIYNLSPARLIQNQEIEKVNNKEVNQNSKDLRHIDENEAFEVHSQVYMSLETPLDFSDFTISIWVLLDGKDHSAEMKTILSNKETGCDASPSRDGYSLYVNSWETENRQLIFEWGNSRSGCEKVETPGAVIQYDVWTHIAVGVSYDSVTLYVDGEKIASRIQISRNLQKSNQLKFGIHADNLYPFHGSLKNFIFWSETLSSSNIQEIYETTKSQITGLSIKPMPMVIFTLKDGKKDEPESDAIDLISMMHGKYHTPVIGSHINYISKPEDISEEAIKVSDELGRIRRDFVKNAMKHAWNGYKQFAFGYDELKPLSRQGHNNWGGIGVTLVDSLDTLWLMGMKDEFWEARNWVKNKLDFSHTGSVSLFETTIRELGGLLSAYDLSDDSVFLDKAEDLGKRLLSAFNTPTGIPRGQVSLMNLRGGGGSGGSSVLSEIGTLQVEFRYLSEKTGNTIFAEKVNRIFDILSEKHPQHGLYPIYIDSNSGSFTTRSVTFGALGDSFYEYLLKVWLQGGKKETKYREMFDEAMDGVSNILVQRSSPSGLIYISDWDGRRNQHKMDHLVCFLPGILALGSVTNPDQKSFRVERDMQLAKELMYTCYQMYARQPTGIAPEFVNFISGNDMQPGPNAAFYILRPETAESLFVLNQLTKDPIYRQWGWEIFSSIEKYCKTDIAYGAIPDVRATNRHPEDRMESFFLAETLKYLYLLQDPDHPINLMEYVFNTEAHPLKIFHY